MAVVASGGGARGAYEAGALAELVPALVGAGLRPTVFVGTSAGSINAVLLASVAHRFETVASTRAALDDVVQVWSTMRCADVFRPLLRSVWRTTAVYLAEVARLPSARLSGLLDTTPLERTASERVDWEQLHRNVDDGHVEAVALAATTPFGWTRLFLEHAPGTAVPAPDDVRALDYCAVRLTQQHVRASCAIPVLFPPVRVDEPEAARGWYCDGGVRLNAPLKPAIALGADALVVVACHATAFASDRSAASASPRPEVDDVAAQVLDSLMGDRMIEDLLTLGKVNEGVGAGDRGAPGGPRSTGGRAYVPVPYLAVGPRARATLGVLAQESYMTAFSGPAGVLRAAREPDLPILRRLTGGGDGARGGDLLSYLFFDRSFGEAAARLGREDARRLLVQAVTPHAEQPPGTTCGSALPWRLRAPQHL